MTADSHPANSAPRNALSAPLAASTPLPGASRHPERSRRPQRAAQGFEGERTAPETWHEPCTNAQPHPDPDHEYADLHHQHATAAGIREATTLQPAEEYL